MAKLTDFTGMSRAEMAAWYKDVVGYDPTENDPTVTDEQLRSDCAEMDFYYHTEVDPHGRGRDHPDFDPAS